jgi:hypothetical protein
MPTATPVTVGAVVVVVVVVLDATVAVLVAKSEDPHPAVARANPARPKAAATVRRGCRPTDPSITCTLSAPLGQVRVRSVGGGYLGETEEAVPRVLALDVNVNIYSRSRYTRRWFRSVRDEGSAVGKGGP